MTNHTESNRMTQSRKNIVRKNNEHKNHSLDIIRNAETTESLRNMAQLYLTKGQLAKYKANEYTLEQLQTVLIDRVEKRCAKKLAAMQNKLNEIYAAQPLETGTMRIQWSTTSVWGFQPKGEYTSNHTYTYYTRKPNTCNVDLLSVVTANLLNQDTSLMRTIIEYIDSNNIEELTRDNIGYGIDYFGGMPEFCHGVGFTSHRQILEKLGYSVAWTDTKNSDVIHILSEHN